MVSLPSWKYPWSLVLAIGLLLILASAIHVFLSPLFPSSLDFFGARQSSASCAPFNASSDHGRTERWDDVEWGARFPADSHGAVTYRGAPWKAEIGRWLSGCGSALATVQVVEVLVMVLIPFLYGHFSLPSQPGGPKKMRMLQK
ncbi:hypothetical protein BHE74_00030930 [Ensete ventricosum]|nr:hypothetical protein GW17_00035621 [Ensete ventricosum]RWW61971.1 hypothetical protein BHE74_00030930 [Ensete ventricosum]